MENQDLRTLKILEEIENDHTPSQRDLAKTLNISLGLVNSFIKRLAQKGYFKITTIPRNRVRYILTPKGAAEKTRLTYEYIQYSFQFYKKARKKFGTLFKDLQTQGIQRVVFYGATDLTEIAFITIQETTIQLVAVVDDVKIGGKFLKYIIADPDKLMNYIFDRVVVTNIDSKDRILQKLQAKGIPLGKTLMFE